VVAPVADAGAGVAWVEAASARKIADGKNVVNGKASPVPEKVAGKGESRTARSKATVKKAAVKTAATRKVASGKTAPGRRSRAVAAKTSASKHLADKHVGDTASE
jgi:hypothetical protein